MSSKPLSSARLSLAATVSTVFLPGIADASCDQNSIDRLSIEQAAEEIWSASDVIGFGYVSTVNTPEREQQFIDLVVTIKGPSDGRIPYVPLRIGRLAPVGPGYYRIGTNPDQPVLVSLVRTPQGYVAPACRENLLAKDRPAIIRRLIAMAHQQSAARSE